jgi:hypothetical protein
LLNELAQTEAQLADLLNQQQRAHFVCRLKKIIQKKVWKISLPYFSL